MKNTRNEKIAEFLDIASWRCLLVIVFLLPFVSSFNHFFYSQFDLPRIVFFRTGVLAAGLLILGSVFLKRKIVLSGQRVLIVFAVLIGLSFFVSTFYSIHPELSLWGSYYRHEGLYSLANYGLFLFLLVVGLNSKNRINSLFWTIFLSGTVIGAYGLIQYVGLDPVKWPDGFSFAYTKRLPAAFGQPNFFGDFLLFTIPVSAYLLVRKKNRLPIAVLVFLSVMIQVFCLAHTGSRGAWLGAAAAFGVSVCVYLVFKWKKKAILAIAAVGALVIFSGLTIISLNSGKTYLDSREGLISRIASIADLKSGSNRLRILMWQGAWTEFAQADLSRKLIGWGPEAQTDILIRQFRPEWAVHENISSFADRAHNIVLDTLLQYGIFGLSVLFVFFFFILYRLGKMLSGNSRNEPIYCQPEFYLIAGIAGHMVYLMFSFHEITGYVYFSAFLALAIALGMPARNVKTIDIKYSRFSLAAIWLAVIFVSAVLVYYYNYRYLKADYYYLKAANANAASDCRASLDNAGKVIKLAPPVNYYRTQYLNFLLDCADRIGKDSFSDWRENIEMAVSSMDTEERDYLTLLNLAYANTVFGQYVDPGYFERAEQDYRDLLAINPYRANIYSTQGGMYIRQGKYDDAIEALERGLGVIEQMDLSLANEEHRLSIEGVKAELLNTLDIAYALKGD